MKYIFLICSFFLPLASFGQSADELEIKSQLFKFQKAHNSRNLDSMMMIVSNNYQETFLPNVVYNASGLRNYYRNIIENPSYTSEISYQVEDTHTTGETGITEVKWDYFIFPKKNRDTLYYSQNKGMIYWEKKDGTWKMKKALGGNIKEINRINNFSAEKAIETKILDWMGYFENEELSEVMDIYHKEVKGISTFNGNYITYYDLKQEYENVFNNKDLIIKYELEGLEELSFSEGLAYTIAVWTYNVYDNKRDMLNKSSYRHLSVWEQQDDGEWKIVSFVRKEIEN